MAIDRLVEYDVPLAPLTTLRVGPVARRMFTPTTTAEVISVLRDVPRTALILAGGSNVVLADDREQQDVVRLASNGITVQDNVLRAEAGAVWDDVVVAAVGAGLGGLECLSGIPGSAGATPVQNVGAYGVEVADTMTRVRLFDRAGGTADWVDASELGFGYRHSVLKGSDAAVVLEVEFALDDSGCSAPLRYGELARTLGAADGERTDPERVRAAVLALRRGKGMVLDTGDHDTWSVGSFFTNPVVSEDAVRRVSDMVGDDVSVPQYPAPDGVKLAAGWLVEKAGFTKGYPGADARARLSTKHALALTNRGGASTSDVLDLARRVRDGVHSRFGISLTPEPVLVGCAL